MTDAFPPTPTHGRDVEIMLEVFASVIDGRTAFYVSSPFTTGQRASRWMASNGPSTDAPDFRESVLEANRTHAAAYVSSLRNKVDAPVIAPTALADIDGWTQSDYRFFWGQVIERFVETVTFIDGWAHSSGCAYEFLVAQRCGVRTLAEDWTPLSLTQGLERLGDAIDEYAREGQPTSFLEDVRSALSEISSVGAQP